jgi:hypothetical protein
VEKIDKDMEEVNPQDFFPWGRCSRWKLELSYIGLNRL